MAFKKKNLVSVVGGDWTWLLTISISATIFVKKKCEPINNELYIWKSWLRNGSQNTMAKYARLLCNFHSMFAYFLKHLVDIAKNCRRKRAILGAYSDIKMFRTSIKIKIKETLLDPEIETLRPNRHFLFARLEKKRVSRKKKSFPKKKIAKIMQKEYTIMRFNAISYLKDMGLSLVKILLFFRFMISFGELSSEIG